MTGRQVEPDPATWAARAAEAVRELNFATYPGLSRPPRLEYPCDVYDVLGSLKVMAERLPQLCGQLGRFLEAALSDGRVLAVAGQPYAGDPDAAVTAAALALADAQEAAGNLGGALSRAQQATAGLAHHDPDEDPAPGCGSCGAVCRWAEDAWTCTGCGDEWHRDHHPRYGAPDPDGGRS